MMIPPKILLLSYLTTIVYAQPYITSTSYVPIQKESKTTETPLYYFGHDFNKDITNDSSKETVQKSLLEFDKENDFSEKIEFTKIVQNHIPPTISPQTRLLDIFNDPTESIAKTSEEENSFYINNNDEISSTGTEYRIPVTNIYTRDNTVSDVNSFPLGDTEFQTKSDKISTTTTTITTTATSTSQSTIAPLVTVMPSIRISTKSTASPRLKMGKTIKTYKSSADQVLRQFVENGYLRQPLACIIDTTESNLRKAQMLWNATLRSNAPLDILLSGYNSTGDLFYYVLYNKI